MTVAGSGPSPPSPSTAGSVWIAGSVPVGCVSGSAPPIRRSDLALGYLNLAGVDIVEQIWNVPGVVTTVDSVTVCSVSAGTVTEVWLTTASSSRICAS